MFRFTLVDSEHAESLGVVAFAVPSFKQGEGRTLRVVQVCPPSQPGTYPVLVVELAD